jgi:hypothetical protein
MRSYEGFDGEYVIKKSRRKQWRWTQCIILLLSFVVLVCLSISIVSIVLVTGTTTAAVSSVESVTKPNAETIRRARMLKATQNMNQESPVSRVNQHSNPSCHNMSNHLEDDQLSQRGWIPYKMNVTFNGKPASAWIHLMQAEDIYSEPPRETHSFRPAASNNTQNAISCLPSFTTGVNLTLPAQNYMIDIGSISTLDHNFAVNKFDQGIAVWNSLFRSPIFGSRVTWSGDGPDFDSPDGRNEVTYGSISPSNILAFTIVWAYGSAFPVSQRYIIGWDIVFGDASNTLGDARLDSSTHHYFRVVLHELGHALGLGHCSSDSGCAPLSIMFPSSPAGRVQPELPTPDDIISAYELYPGVSLTLPEEKFPNSSRQVDVINSLAIYIISIIIFEMLCM